MMRIIPAGPTAAPPDRRYCRAVAVVTGEPSVAELLARLGELARLVDSTQGEVRVLAAMPPTPRRERRLAQLYREFDAIAREAACIERRMLG